MLLLPNFAGGGDDEAATTTTTDQSTTTTDPQSEVSGVSNPPAQEQQPVQQQPAEQAPPQQPPVESAPVDEGATAPAGSTTYIVADGDTLWDIAATYSTTVDAIIAANGLANPADLQVGDELIIPPAEESATAATD
jgi:LysM repeat protein